VAGVDVVDGLTHGDVLLKFHVANMAQRHILVKTIRHVFLFAVLRRSRNGDFYDPVKTAGKELALKRSSEL
jgi:hypothetical protein